MIEPVSKEIIILTRDCMAQMVPSGARIMLHRGTEVTLVQALGDSFTVDVFGNYARVDGANADALGKEIVIPLADLPEDATIEERIWAQLKLVYDPEIPVNIVELGLVYECHCEELADGTCQVKIQMTLTAPGCGMGPVIAADAKSKVERIPGISEVNVEVVFDPPWSQDKMSDVAKLELGML